MALIDKDKVVAEIQRRKDYYENLEQIKPVYDSNIADCEELLSFLDTLEVKEIYEHDGSDLDSILEKIGVEHDSKLAKMFKTAFYKSIDNYLAKKGE